MVIYRHLPDGTFLASDGIKRNKVFSGDYSLGMIVDDEGVVDQNMVCELMLGPKRTNVRVVSGLEAVKLWNTCFGQLETELEEYKTEEGKLITFQAYLERMYGESYVFIEWSDSFLILSRQ